MQMVVWLHFSQFLELIVFPQVLILSVEGDVGADKPEDKTMKVKCQLKNCWVNWAGEDEEWELLWWVVIWF